MDNFSRVLQTMDPTTARLVSSLLSKNLLDSENGRQIVDQQRHHRGQLREAALTRSIFLTCAPSTAAVIPAASAACPEPVRPSPLLDITPTIMRSNSTTSSDFSRSNSGFSTSAMLSTPQSSQSGMSTPPSQMSTPCSDGPPRLPHHLKTRKKRQ